MLITKRLFEMPLNEEKDGPRLPKVARTSMGSSSRAPSHAPSESPSTYASEGGLSDIQSICSGVLREFLNEMFADQTQAIRNSLQAQTTAQQQMLVEFKAGVSSQIDQAVSPVARALETQQVALDDITETQRSFAERISKLETLSAVDHTPNVTTNSAAYDREPNPAIVKVSILNTVAQAELEKQLKKDFEGLHVNAEWQVLGDETSRYFSISFAKYPPGSAKDGGRL